VFVSRLVVGQLCVSADLCVFARNLTIEFHALEVRFRAKTQRSAKHFDWVHILGIRFVLSANSALEFIVALPSRTDV